MTFLASTLNKPQAELEIPQGSDDESKIIGNEIFLQSPGGCSRTTLSNNFFERKLGLLADLISELYRDLRPVVEPLTPAEFHWYPGPQANSNFVAAWNIGRGLEFLGTRACRA